MQSDDLLNLLKKTGAMLEGHFLLTSGRHSDIYIEKFRILEKPSSLNRSKYNPLGKGNHQTKIKAGIEKRIPISK